MAIYIRPNSLTDALITLGKDTAIESNERLALVAGATDFYPAQTGKQAWFLPSPKNILDVSQIQELHGLKSLDDHWRIGAMMTWSQLIAHTLPAYFDGLKQAAKMVGGVQIQNRGTLVGNVCNASPAADGMPPLLALNARLELASCAGVRVLALEEFVLGNRKTALRKGEIVTALLIPKQTAHEQSVFLKLGARHYLVISIASVAANIALDAAGKIVDARIVVGSCSAVPQRLFDLEKALIGKELENVEKCLQPVMLKTLNPIDDVRASAEYRKEAALTLVRRALGKILETQRQAA